MIHKYWSNQNIYSQFPRIITVRLNIYFYTAQNTTMSDLSQVMYLNCAGYLLPFNLTRNILVNKSLIIWHEGLNIRYIHTLRVQIVFTVKKNEGKNIRLIYLSFIRMTVQTHSSNKLLCLLLHHSNRILCILWLQHDILRTQIV
jgi:hypothetical protein